MRLSLSSTQSTPPSFRPLYGHARRELAVLRLHERVVDGVVDALDHRRQHGARDADSSGCESTPIASLPFSLAICSAPMPEPPATANTTSEPRSNARGPARRPWPDRSRPRSSCRPYFQHLDRRIDRFRALHVAAGECADQRDVHAADEADVVDLRHGGATPTWRSSSSWNSTELTLLGLGIAVDQHEMHVREFGSRSSARAGSAKNRSRRSGRAFCAQAAQHCSAWVS